MPSLYLKQCWIITNCTLRIKHNIVIKILQFLWRQMHLKMSADMSRPQCVNAPFKDIGKHRFLLLISLLPIEHMLLFDRLIYTNILQKKVWRLEALNTRVLWHNAMLPNGICDKLHWVVLQPVTHLAHKYNVLYIYKSHLFGVKLTSHPPCIINYIAYPNFHCCSNIEFLVLGVKWDEARTTASHALAGNDFIHFSVAVWRT